MHKNIKVIIFYIISILVIIIIYRQKQELKQLKTDLNESSYSIQSLKSQIDNLKDNYISNSVTHKGFSDYDFQTIYQQTSLPDIYKPELLDFLQSETLATGESLTIPFDQSFKIGEGSFFNSLLGGAKHVVIRPDDIWSLIVHQISVYSRYFNNNFNSGDSLNFKLDSNKTINNQVLENEFERVLSTTSFSNITNLISLIKPSFSTTLPNDNIAILSQLFKSKEISYSQSAFFTFNTAIPNIRIFGLKSDYIQIIEKLKSIVSQIESNNNDGKLTIWMDNIIIPILKEFIEIAPESSHRCRGTGFQDNIVISKSTRSEFWKRIFSSKGEEFSSVDAIDGWISNFFYFRDFGVLEPVSSDAYSTYFKLNRFNFPSGYSAIPVNMLDINGNTQFQSILFGGHITVDIVENYKFSPRLDWVLKKIKDNNNENSLNVFGIY